MCRRIIRREHCSRNCTTIAKLNCRVKRRVELVGTGDGARDRKGDHAVATGRGDARALTGKFFDGGIERIARTVGFVLSLTLELKLLVTTVDVVLQGVFKLVKVILEAVFDRG